MWTPLEVEGRGVWTSAHPADGKRGRADIAQVAVKGKGGFMAIFPTGWVNAKMRNADSASLAWAARRYLRMIIARHTCM
jgi:hypothetical protein